MLEIIRRLCKRHKFCGIYTDRSEADKFDAGYIEAFDEEYILMSAVSPDGEYDGYVVIPVKNIFQIDYDNIYLKDVEKFYRYEKKENINLLGGKSLLIGAMEYAKANRVCCICDFSDYSVMGYLNDITDGCAVINVIDENANLDGYTAVYVGDIRFFSFDLPEDKKDCRADRGRVLRFFKENI